MPTNWPSPQGRLIQGYNFFDKIFTLALTRVQCSYLQPDMSPDRMRYVIFYINDLQEWLMPSPVFENYFQEPVTLSLGPTIIYLFLFLFFSLNTHARTEREDIFLISQVFFQLFKISQSRYICSNCFHILINYFHTILHVTPIIEYNNSIL